MFHLWRRGVADVDITALIVHHRAQGRLATVTVEQPPGRYGALQVSEAHGASGFQEKPQGVGCWINGGLLVLEPEVIDWIEGNSTIWEQEPLKGWPVMDSTLSITTPVSGSRWIP
jgi:glucose-1-phosphate cytidylyltransferase